MPQLPPPGLKPLDLDGVSAMVTGTVAWAVAALVCALRWQTLTDSDTVWWFYSCLAGVFLGVLGIVYCARRRTALQRRAERAEAAEQGGPEQG